MSEESISKAIVQRCKIVMGPLIVLDVVIGIFFFITLTINIVGALAVALLFVIVILFTNYIKKAQKDPLKYRKYFFNIEKEAMAIEQSEQMRNAQLQQRATVIEQRKEMKMSQLQGETTTIDQGNEMEKTQLQEEVNFMSNKTVVESLSKVAFADLCNYKYIESNWKMSVDIGYVYQDTYGKLNALYKIMGNNKVFYYICAKGRINMVNIDEGTYQTMVKNTFINHKCLQTLEGADTKERPTYYKVREENLTYDRESNDFVANLALKYLTNNKIIDNYNYINVDFGYIYLNENGKREALFKIIKGNSAYYFLLKNEFELTLLNWTEEQYITEIEKSKKDHECLNYVPLKETESEKIRKEKNNNIIKSKGIVCSDSLLCNSESRNLKDIDELCKKAIASLLIVQIANDTYHKADVDYTIKVMNELLDKFGVRSYLNSKEMKIINNNYTEQDMIDIIWEYEIYWSICWVLGLVDDISDGGLICDSESALSFVFNVSSLEEFKSRCKLRSKEEILDMEDLYFRYQWAINENILNSNTSIGNLNKDIVCERYRGLKWALSNEEDWYNISLDA